jgi:tetratricopeptide (TPR) repeat protein
MIEHSLSRHDLQQDVLMLYAGTKGSLMTSNWQNILEEGRKALDKQDFHQALQLSDQVAQGGHEARYFAAVLRGQVLLELGDYPTALSCFESVADPKIPDSDIDLARGITFFHLLQFPEAINALYSALRGRPKAAEAYYTLALIAEVEGHDHATELFRQARLLSPDRFGPVSQRSRRDFEDCITSAIAALPGAYQASLRSLPLLVMEIPRLEDLRRQHPLVSPTTASLCVTLDEPSDEAHDTTSILLFKRNCERSFEHREQLVEGIRSILHHEICHIFDFSNVRTLD